MRKVKFFAFVFLFIILSKGGKYHYQGSNKLLNDTVHNNKPLVIKSNVDTINVQQLLLHLAHDSVTNNWPIRDKRIPNGALLPYYRIIAYYGNFSSKRMGILGALPQDSMIKSLMGEIKKWSNADTLIPTLPALHLVTVVAQQDSGKDGKYRNRIPLAQIDKALRLARKIHGIVFLDLQVGRSNVSAELPRLSRYLRQPDVHLAIDPEFSIKDTSVPGISIGTFEAADINYTTRYLTGIVRKYHLPPKILVVHSFTECMVPDYQAIRCMPEVQIVMNMDAWGSPATKIRTYNLMQTNRPVDFTGFKLFYKNDADASSKKTVMQPREILALYPSPVFIQYQ